MAATGFELYCKRSDIRQQSPLTITFPGPGLAIPGDFQQYRSLSGFGARIHNDATFTGSLISRDALPAEDEEHRSESYISLSDV
jgi:hypothetical protein